MVCNELTCTCNLKLFASPDAVKPVSLLDVSVGFTSSVLGVPSVLLSLGRILNWVDDGIPQGEVPIVQLSIKGIN